MTCNFCLNWGHYSHFYFQRGLVSSRSPVYSSPAPNVLCGHRQRVLWTVSECNLAVDGLQAVTGLGSPQAVINQTAKMQSCHWRRNPVLDQLMRKLVANGGNAILSHRPDNEWGENVAYTWTSRSVHELDAKEVTSPVKFIFLFYWIYRFQNSRKLSLPLMQSSLGTVRSESMTSTCLDLSQALDTLPKWYGKTAKGGCFIERGHELHIECHCCN